MHALALLPGLLAVVTAGGVLHQRQSCGAVHPPLGSRCATEGQLLCDVTCSSILICHDGTIQLNSPCAPGGCVWREDTKSPYCTERAVEELGEQLDGESADSCGLTRNAGDKCPETLQDGGILCDRGCNNVLKCVDGVMVADQDCGQDGQRCNFNPRLPLDNGAFCTAHRDDVEGIAPDTDADSATILGRPGSKGCEIPWNWRVESRASCLPLNRAKNGQAVCAAKGDEDDEEATGEDAICVDGVWAQAHCEGSTSAWRGQCECRHNRAVCRMPDNHFVRLVPGGLPWDEPDDEEDAVPQN